jgi:lipopolysaccharide transport system ATP-binding protein
VSSKGGRTVIFVSHNMTAMESLCTRALLLGSGHIIAKDDALNVIREYLHIEVESTLSKLDSEHSQNIKAIRMSSAEGVERDTFQIGETIVFEVELVSSAPIDHPRFGIGIHLPNGVRIATLHTDIQYLRRWSLDKERTLRVTWKDVPLNVGQYRIDAGLWSFDKEEETLVGCKTLFIESKDIYGTGRLPDPSYQGHVVPNAVWAFSDVS